MSLLALDNLVCIGQPKAEAGNVQEVSRMLSMLLAVFYVMLHGLHTSGEANEYR
jgi:hypothetical protein